MPSSKIQNRLQGVIFFLPLFVVTVIGVYLPHTPMLEDRSEDKEPINIISAESAFRLLNSEGDPVNLQDLTISGQESWLFLFSTGCPTCISLLESGSLQPEDGIYFISFSPLSFIRKFQDEQQFELKVFHASLGLAKILKIENLPVMVKIDESGNVLEKISRHSIIKNKVMELRT